ncbi:MAG: hypothetical protein WD716_06655 [Fimbriimonadaceae bacterium]
MNRWWLLFLGLVLLGCGGGGGPAPVVAVLVGRVLWIESNAAPDPVASVTSGGNSTTTDVVDGSFQLDTALGATNATISWSDGGAPVVFTFTFPPASGVVDIGDVYIGPDTVTVHGTVIDSSSGLPVEGALVKLAGRSAITAANGEFNVLDVAYSNAAPAAFGDLIGEVSMVLYVTRQFSPPVNAVAGVVEVGTLQITPESAGDPPPLPANITGRILPLPAGAGALVELLDGPTVIRSTIADGAGEYRFWVGVGTYTVRATSGLLTGSESVTVTSQNVQQVVDVQIS